MCERLEDRVERLEEALTELAKFVDGLHEAIENLSLENERIRIELKAREHGWHVMSYLERQ